MTTNNIKKREEFVLLMNETAITRIFDHDKNKELMNTLLTYHENPALGDSKVFDNKIGTLYERTLLASRLTDILGTKSGTTTEETQGHNKLDYYTGLYSTLYSLTKLYKPPK